MRAVVLNFCGGKTSKKGNHIIIELDGVKNKVEAAKSIGKKVIWTTSSGKRITGEITKAHGNSGAVKAIMEKGLPGTVLGKEIQIEG